MTDLGRLHEVALTDPDDRERAAGQTTLDCNTVVGVIGLGHETVVVVLPKLDRMDRVAYMLEEALINQGYSKEWFRKLEWNVFMTDAPKGYSKVVFTSQAFVDRKLIGLGDVPVVEFR
jgi:hypothetical protein